jgi:hypothetical protein
MTQDLELDFTGIPQIVTAGDTARARKSDPLESHLAADSNINREAVEEHVLHLFKRFGPMTDHALTVRYFADTTSPESDIDSPRKRRSDLAKRGAVIPTLLHGVGRTGRKATVWQVAA